MAYGVPTDMTTLLAQMTLALSSAPFSLPGLRPTPGPMDLSQIQPTLANDETIEGRGLTIIPTKQIFLAIRPDVFPVGREDRAGGGRSFSGRGWPGIDGGIPMNGTFKLLFYSRLGTHPINWEYTSITDPVYGVGANWLAILNQFEQWSPLDPAGSGNSIVIEPMRILAFDTVMRRQGTTFAWTRLNGQLSVKFVQSMTPIGTAYPPSV